MKALIGTAMAVCLALPAMARVEGYGPRRYAQVGGHGWHGRPDGHNFVVDHRGGPGWAGVLAGGIVGAAAGLALAGAAGPPPVYVAPAPVYAPPAIGTVLPALPEDCVEVPNYSGGALYNCGNIYYQPFYEGTSLMYEVVPAP